MQGRIENKIKVEQMIGEMIKNYPNYMKKYYLSLNGNTHMTKYRYIQNICRFLDYYKEVNGIELKNLKDIDSFDIEEYISSISYYDKDGDTKELTDTSKAPIYSSLSNFFEFLIRNEYINNNPFANGKIKRPRRKENDVVFLTPEEVAKVEANILNGCGNARAIGKQRNWKYRDLLLFRIPVVNGLRIEALREININDINLKEMSIKVTEKGNINKKVYFDAKTKEYMLRWLNDRIDLMTEEEYNSCKALFISSRKTRMCAQSIADIITKYTKTATSKHITPHKLRSTCGTNIYQQTKDIYLVANVLGHKSTEPTKRYTKCFNEDKQAAIINVAKIYDSAAI